MSAITIGEEIVLDNRATSIEGSNRNETEPQDADMATFQSNDHIPKQPGFRDPPINTWRGLGAALGFLTQGAHDGVAGALLPYIEAQYHTSYSITSLIFVANAIGFIAASPLVHAFEQRLGRARLLALAAGLNSVAYGVIIARPPFPALAVMYGVLGFGFSCILSLDNSFIANLRNGAVLLGSMQGCYGIGGTVSPLIGTALASHSVPWSYFYSITLGLSVASAVVFGWTFRGFESWPPRAVTDPTTDGNAAGSRQVLAKALRDRSIILGAIFVFAYQGAEVTISGWVVSFLIDYRHGDSSRVGYVTAGFWGGITLGRFLLCPIIHRLGDRVCVQVIIFLWAGFQLIVWLVPNIIGNAVGIAIIGFISGPVAPVATGYLSRLLSPDIQMTGISFAWSVGSGGAAVAPFITGLLAQKFGTIVLNPAVIVLCVVMEVAWVFLPKHALKEQ